MEKKKNHGGVDSSASRRASLVVALKFKINKTRKRKIRKFSLNKSRDEMKPREKKIEFSAKAFETPE